MAEEYFEKALSIFKSVRCAEIEFRCYLCLTLTKLSQGKFSYLPQSIKNTKICEKLIQNVITLRYHRQASTVFSTSCSVDCCVALEIPRMPLLLQNWDGLEP